MTSKKADYDVRTTGRLLLQKPDWDLVRRKFRNSFVRYAACVRANFGDIPDVDHIERQERVA